MSQTSIINKKTGKRYTFYGIAKDATNDSSVDDTLYTKTKTERCTSER